MKKKYSAIELRTFNIRMEEKIAANCTRNVIVNTNAPPCGPISGVFDDGCLDGSVLSGQS